MTGSGKAKKALDGRGVIIVFLVFCETAAILSVCQTGCMGDNLFAQAIKKGLGARFVER